MNDTFLPTTPTAEEDATETENDGGREVKYIAATIAATTKITIMTIADSFVEIDALFLGETSIMRLVPARTRGSRELFKPL